MKVYLAQLKCPSNHCVLAAAGEFETDEAAAVLAYRLGTAVAEMQSDGVLKYECGICKSTELHVDIGQTPFDSLDEARPFLKAVEQLQQLARHAKN